jgi:hypothetical protein
MVGIDPRGKEGVYGTPWASRYRIALLVLLAAGMFGCRIEDRLRTTSVTMLKGYLRPLAGAIGTTRAADSTSHLHTEGRQVFLLISGYVALFSDDDKTFDHDSG